jgi:hypothetical protein
MPLIVLAISSHDNINIPSVLPNITIPEVDSGVIGI